MSSITMCVTSDCSLKNSCLRATPRIGKFINREDFQAAGCTHPHFGSYIFRSAIRHTSVAEINMATLLGRMAEDHDYISVHLPKLRILPDWSVYSQFDKIDEEVAEVKEAVMAEDWRNAAKESLDAMQTFGTLLNMIMLIAPDLDLCELLLEHDSKLERKGYK